MTRRFPCAAFSELTFDPGEMLYPVEDAAKADVLSTVDGRLAFTTKSVENRMIGYISSGRGDLWRPWRQPDTTCAAT
jgi:hypothetical protein